MAMKTVGDRNAQDDGMLDRLKDQLKVQKRVQEIHSNVRKLTEYAFYPKHDARKETKEYKAVHNKLVKDLDLPCLICGVKNSTLSDKKKIPMAQNRWRLITMSLNGLLQTLSMLINSMQPSCHI